MFSTYGQARLLWLSYALGVVGLIDSGYLFATRLSGNSLVCGVLDGCNVVAASPYSNLFGTPLSLWGVLFYLGALALLVGFSFLPLQVSRNLFLAWTFLGVVMSAYFVYVQAVLIQAFCTYCLLSAGASFLLFVFAVFLHRARRPISEPLLNI